MTKTKKKNRKDSKGKVLRTGESERSNGTYMYRYVPKIRGRSVNSPEKKDNRITIYAKTLPELRQKELQITQDIIEEIDTVNGNKTVASMTKLYIDLKKNLHFTTRESYLSVYRCHIKDSWFGEMCIKDVTKTDVILFYNEITEDLTNSFLENVHRIIHGCFDLALENHWIRFNPTQNVMRLYPTNVPERQPYTKEQENLLLNFVKNDGTYYIYYPLIICFLETMLRASDDDDKIRLNQRKPSKYKGLSRFGPEKNLQRINKFMKERPTFYKKLIQMKENFRFYLRCFYCITKVVILQFNSEKQDRISS